jgi:hypothetical protein
VGSRHQRVRKPGEGYHELFEAAKKMREQMDKLTKLISTPDRSFNAVMERVGALMLHHAAVEGV